MKHLECELNLYFSCNCFESINMHSAIVPHMQHSSLCPNKNHFEVKMLAMPTVWHEIFAGSNFCEFCGIFLDL